MSINTKDAIKLRDWFYQNPDLLSLEFEHAISKAQDHAYGLGLVRARTKQFKALKREIRYLRHYGNKDCTAMAEEAMARGDLDEDKKKERA